MNEKYESLKKELPSIAESVKNFPDALQGSVFNLLISNFLGESITKPNASQAPVHQEEGKTEIPGIARLDSSGNFNITIRNPKATSKEDAYKKLTYMIIRAYLMLKPGESGISRKDVINPILKKWRLNDGNCRKFLANDVGISRDGDIFSLDVHASEEADDFMKQVLDDSVLTNWTISSRTAKKKKSKTKETTK